MTGNEKPDLGINVVRLADLKCDICGEEAHYLHHNYGETKFSCEQHVVQVEEALDPV